MKNSEIESRVNQIIDEYDVEQSPTDVFSIIEGEGISLTFEEMEDNESGFVLVEDGKASIVINGEHHPNRQRFTAAHELGHFLLHCADGDYLFVDAGFKRSPRSSEGTHQKEIEANKFAASLLMPESWLREDTQDLDVTDFDVFNLSLRYEVSEQAMTLRLVNLRLIDS